MRLYRLLARLFPRSFTAKVFFLAFLGTHVPLVAFVAAMLKERRLGDEAHSLLLLTLATLLGTGATLLALRAVLRPLFLVADHLGAWDAGGHPGHLPEGFADEVGRVMHHANQLMDRASRAVDLSRTEAETDALTGVLNRRGARRWLAGCEAGWLVQFDIDHFKAVNDRFGHDAGDEVIRQVARTAASVLRPGDMLARFGGEEFVIVLPSLSAEAAEAVAGRLRAAVEAGVRLPSGPVTISAGLAPHAGGPDIDEALRRSDVALYRAKRSGRNRVCLPVPADDLP